MKIKINKRGQIVLNADAGRAIRAIGETGASQIVAAYLNSIDDAKNWEDCDRSVGEVEMVE